jgi:serine/threonine-protein kinase PRP4
MPQRAGSVERKGTSQDDTKSTKMFPGETTTAHISVEAPTPEDSLQEEEPLDEAAEIERRRRRREELLAKTRGPTPMLVQALHGAEKVALGSPAYTQQSTPQVTEANTPRSGKLTSAAQLLKPC